MRPSGRAPDEMRAIEIQTGYTKHAEGSVLVGFGDTRVIVTASVEEKVPPFLRGKAQGWVTAEYSTDSGSTYTALSATAATSGLYRITSFDLSGITAAEAIRFRFTFDRGTNATDSTEMVAWTMSFAFLENGKRAWHFVVNGADEIEGRDGASVTQDVSDYASNLWSWARDRTALVFTDLDGTTANVQIVGLKEHQPIIGPNIDGEARPEAHFAVSLLEV